MTTKRTLATMKRNFEQEIDIENQRCTLKVVRSDWEPPEVFHVDLGKLPPDMQTEFMARGVLSYLRDQAARYPKPWEWPSRSRVVSRAWAALVRGRWYRRKVQ